MLSVLSILDKSSLSDVSFQKISFKSEYLLILLTMSFSEHKIFNFNEVQIMDQALCAES